MTAPFNTARAQPLWLLCLTAPLVLLGACSDSPPPAPSISLQRSDTATTAGRAATVSVSASGPDLVFQWQRSNDAGVTWLNINGATAASYITPATVVADNGSRYRDLESARRQPSRHLGRSTRADA